MLITKAGDGYIYIKHTSTH